MLCKGCCVLRICCPGGVVLPPCTIVAWSLVGVAIGIDETCDSLSTPFVFDGVGFFVYYGLGCLA